mmetsp:Transcript_1213/g.2894  ORF Transcript_1213/g.2894 Transcript_1213/m.2894 type:complete len:308 (+) Transcript_1213:851-1774(+)
MSLAARNLPLAWYSTCALSCSISCMSSSSSTTSSLRQSASESLGGDMLSGSYVSRCLTRGVAASCCCCCSGSLAAGGGIASALGSAATPPSSASASSSHPICCGTSPSRDARYRSWRLRWMSLRRAIARCTLSRRRTASQYSGSAHSPLSSCTFIPPAISCSSPWLLLLMSPSRSFSMVAWRPASCESSSETASPLTWARSMASSRATSTRRASQTVMRQSQNSLCSWSWIASSWYVWMSAWMSFMSSSVMLSKMWYGYGSRMRKSSPRWRFWARRSTGFALPSLSRMLDRTLACSRWNSSSFFSSA